MNDDLATFHHGDCVEVMATMPADSVDAVVTDPPYGLEFMGKEWDSLGNGFRRREPADVGRDDPFGRASRTSPEYRGGSRMQGWHTRWATEAYRLLKPGGYLLAFGGTRTVHRLASAIEDAGFEIRDCLVWAYASGFPKSLDVSKAIDKAARAGLIRDAPAALLARLPNNTRWDWQLGGHAPGEKWWRNIRDELTGADGIEPEVLAYVEKAVGWFTSRESYEDTAPATDAAKRWQGWGTALKPAWEPIVMARKPLIGTVAANVAAHGTGALNIDGTRIGLPPPATVQGGQRSVGGLMNQNGGERGTVFESTLGRWPANVILTDPLFDGGVPGVVGGGRADGSQPIKRPDGFQRFDGTDYNGGEAYQTGPYTSPGYGDTGTYSRFFLIPKADRADREPLVRGLPEGRVAGRNRADGRQWDIPGSTIDNGKRNRANVHPTVKPVELMRHLVRLVTPPGGLILDPFLGSGTTAIAANMEGFRFIGIEREAEYLEIARARMAHQKIGLGL